MSLMQKLDTMPKKVGAVLVALVALALVYNAVTGSLNRSFNVIAPSYPGEAYYDEDSSGVSSRGVADYASPESAPSPSKQVASTKRQVIRNGEMALIVEKIEEAMAAIKSRAEQAEGHVANSNFYQSRADQKSGSITVKVPANKLDEVMTAVKTLAVKVERETVTSDDVTERYVDIEAQLTNWKAEEQQYRDLMAKATRIEDILSITERLSDVRGRIEQQEAQLRNLANQIEMSTLNVSLTSLSDVEVLGLVWRPLTTAKLAFNNAVRSLIDFADWLIAFLVSLPVYLIKLGFGVLLVWLAWKILKWFKRRFFPTTPAALS